MEGYNGGLRGYWHRKRYQRLDGAGGGEPRRRRSHRHRVQLGAAPGGQADGAGGTRRRRRFWRLKIAPRLGFLRRVVSPGRLLARIRDAYVRMMLRFANSRVFSAGGLGYYGGDPVPAMFARPALKEYDEKMIMEIYRTLVAQGHLLAAASGDAATGGAKAGRTLTLPVAGTSCPPALPTTRLRW